LIPVFGEINFPTIKNISTKKVLMKILGANLFSRI